MEYLEPAGLAMWALAALLMIIGWRGLRREAKLRKKDRDYRGKR